MSRANWCIAGRWWHRDIGTIRNGQVQGIANRPVAGATTLTAASTWKGEWWKFGGGATVWNAMAYDPKYNTLLIGTGNGAPWNRRLRSNGQGDNLFVDSIVALNVDTGAYKWHYQTVPGDTWDFDATMDLELADLTIGGKPRKVIMQAPHQERAPQDRAQDG